MTSLLWLRLHRAPPSWDDSWYLSNSLTLYDDCVDGGIAGCAHGFLASLGFKAPLITALPLPFYCIFGRRWHAAYLVNTFAALLLFASIWAVATRLRGRRAAWMSVAIAGTLPLLYGLSRWFLVEYSLAALVAAAFWVALAARRSSDPRLAAAFGAVCGLGLLLKADFPLFIAPMAISLLISSSRRWRTAAIIAISALLLAGPWYALHWRATLSNAFSAGYGFSAIVQGTGPVFSVSSLVSYLGIVTRRGVSAYYLLLIAVAAAVALLQKRPIFRDFGTLGLWVAPFVVFAFGGNKDVRYIAPILPAFAIATGCFLDSATEKLRWLGPTALVYPLLASCAVSFGWWQSADLGYAMRFDSSSWRHDEILGTIAGTTLFPHGGRKVLLLGTDRGRFNADNFALSVTQDRIPLVVKTTAYANNLVDLLDLARDADYFVYKEGGEPESQFFNLHTAELIGRLRASPEWAELPFGRTLPDGGVARILRRHQPCAAQPM